MNQERRKQLKAIAARLGALQERMTDEENRNDAKQEFNDLIESAVSDIESVKSDEEGAFDNLPEGLQNSRQDDHDGIIEGLDEAISALDTLDCFADDDPWSEINDSIDTAKEKLIEQSGN